MNSKVALTLRILFAISLVVFGLNKFLHFIPTLPLEGTAGELMNLYVTSGFMKIIGGLEVIGGISLIVNKFAPLSLTFMTAIMFNAVVFHLLHDLAGLGPAVFGLSIALVNVYFYRSRFTNLLSA
ncbi:MAG: DoxX family membrane protein [Saprospiraceae bacterium]